MTPPLSPESRQQLQTLAEAATPGRWRCSGWDVFEGDGEWEACIDSPTGLLVTVPSGETAHEPQPDDSHQSYRDAAFIAACDPQTVLALLSALAAQEAENEQLKRTNVWLEAERDTWMGFVAERDRIICDAHTSMTELEKRWRAEMLANKQFGNRQRDYWQKQLADAQAQTARHCADELAALRQSLAASTPEQET